MFTRVVLVKLGGKFHEKPSKGEEGLWRVAEMATKNAMFIGQPHTQRHLWRKRNGQKLERSGLIKILGKLQYLEFVLNTMRLTKVEGKH